MNRLFGWHLTHIGIYTLGGSSLGLFLTSYRDCRLRVQTTDYEGRAIGEKGSHPIPYAEEWTVELGALVDADLPDLLDIYMTYGAGPFTVWIVRSDGKNYSGTVIIGTADLTSPDGPMTQSATLKVQGSIVPTAPP